jgi:pSer/pThr/pTyr-binding forkhead associated (FHA) protein
MECIKRITRKTGDVKMALYKLKSDSLESTPLRGTEDTFPVFEKKPIEDDRVTAELKKFIESMSLNCYKYEKGHWSLKEFSENKQVIKIGKDSQIVDVTLHDEQESEDIQLTVRLTGRQWFIIETGVKNITSINGIKRRQAVLKQNSSCFLEIGSTQVILTTVKEGQKNDAILDIMDHNIFVLKNGSQSKEFPLHKTILIGSNPVCDVILRKGPEFAAVIAAYGKKLYLHSIFGEKVFANRTQVTKPMPISHESELVIEDLKLTVELPSDNRQAIGFSKLPDYSEARLCLHEIKDNGNPGMKIIMPPKGRSVFIGRDEGNYFSLDDKKVSRKHAQFIIYENSMLVLDCYSTNGTFINNKRVGKTRIHPGDMLRMGDLNFLVNYSE